MQFADPRTDFAFKKIFGSEQGQAALLSMINSVMGLQGVAAICEITLVDPYQPPPVANLKSSYLDVKAIDGAGRRYVIEMQVEPVKEFTKRIVYNASKAYCGQLKTGADYARLVQVVSMTFCDFQLFPEFSHYLSEHRIREQVTSQVYLDEIRYYFVELPKFGLTAEQLGTPLEKWCYFLKHAGRLDHVPPSLTDEPFATAFSIAARSNMTPAEWEAYDAAAVYLQDQKGKLLFALEQGEAIGVEKGVAIGVEQGRAIGREEGFEVVARRMREQGYPRDVILQLTGVDVP